jgi:hypothetical protein
MDTGGKFYIGTTSEDKTKVLYDPDDLTTHAVVVGMTGSGKTGLCIDMLEEAALQNIPALMIDPKGDITNTLLHFPELKPSDFEPWINPDEARKKDISLAQAAEKTALKWQKGLKGSGIDKERIQKLKDSVQFTIYTPGSKAGMPINILASLEAPDLDWDENEELLREKISSTVTALLGLIGFDDIDPVQSREHILLANIFEETWKNKNDLSLSDLIQAVQKPPFEKLGVFELSTFFPDKDRFGLAMRLNNILASPSFQSWVQGDALDIQSLLYTKEGKPKHSVFYIAHLSDAERMFFVTLLYAAYETWMRSQSGTTSLRSILYFDEIMGYIPPTANPSSKPIMLRMLKQGRAFGVAQILVTQNPIDLDYKAMSNAGTWMIGKLQTENDKKRLLEGLEGVTSAAINRKKYDKLITGLKKREFLLHNVHEKKPITFSTRWAINYLAGPLTRTQIPALNHLAGVGKSAGKSKKESVKKTPQVKTATIKSSSNNKISPLSAETVAFYLPNNLSLSEAYLATGRDLPEGAKQIGLVYKPALIAQADVRFLNRTYSLDKLDAVACLVEDEEIGNIVNWEEHGITSLSDAQLKSSKLSDAEFSSVSKKLNTAKNLKSLSSDFINWIYANHRLTLQFNKTLKIYSSSNQSEGDFRKTISQSAEKESSKEIKKLKTTYNKKVSALKKKVTKEKRELDEDEKDHSQRKMMELATHFENIFSSGSSRRRISSSLSKRRQTAKAKLDVQESLEVIDELQDEIEDLLVEMEDAIDDVEEKWAEVASQIEEISIAPFKKDIFMSQFGVAWIPYLQIETGQAGTVEIIGFGQE